MAYETKRISYFDKPKKVNNFVEIWHLDDRLNTIYVDIGNCKFKICFFFQDFCHLAEFHN